MKKVKFIRFGGLSPVKQEGYDPDMPSFHCPPAKYGIYSFIYPYVEPFLLGGSFSDITTKHSKFQYVKDENGVRVKRDEYEKMYNENYMKSYTSIKVDDEYYVVKPKKYKVFEHTDEIWHHLGYNLKPSQILSRKGDWYLTDYRSFVEAFEKEKHNCLKQTKRILQTERFSNNPFWCITKDHLEVFIEKVK